MKLCLKSCLSLCFTLSDLEDCALAPDAIKDARVVDGNVLFCDYLDDLLRHDTTGESCDIVQLSSACSRTSNLLAVAVTH